MSDKNPLDGRDWGAHWVRRRLDRRFPPSDEPHFLRRLGVADYISLVALLFGWAAAVLLLNEEPNWAIVAMMAAFGFDKLDGFYAREFGEPTSLGRQIDAYIDVFTYLVPGAALYHLTMSPHVAASVVVGFVLLAFGGLRLIRFTNEGLQGDQGTSYYRGLTVVHANLLVVANYLAVSFLPLWNGWAAAATVLLVSPLMVSNYRSYKTTGHHSLVGVVGLVVIGCCLILEYGV